MSDILVFAMLQHPIPPELLVDWMVIRQIAESFFLSVSVVAISLGLGIPLVRHWIRRSEQRQVLPAQEVAARLARIEHAVEAIAIEVERVSESQRFLTRLGAERQSLPERIAERSR